MKKNGMALEHLVKHSAVLISTYSDYYKNGIIQAALDSNGLALQFLDEKLRNEYAIVITAVRNNGLALKHTNILDSHKYNPQQKLILLSEAIQCKTKKKESYIYIRANELWKKFGYMDKYIFLQRRLF
jgi:hypothetical protein